MINLPPYTTAVKTNKINQENARIRHYAKVTYRHCTHERKRLKKIWKGASMDYHIMACVDCGMAQIWPAEKDTGIILMDSEFIAPSDKFFKLVKLFNESKNERHNSEERQSDTDD
jgi:hypothetical protein